MNEMNALADAQHILRTVSRLYEAKKSGINRNVWEVKYADTENYPHYTRKTLDKILLRKSEFKSPSENHQNYIRRMIDYGNLSGLGDGLYIKKGKVILLFECYEKQPCEQNLKINEENAYEIGLDGRVISALDEKEHDVVIRTNYFKVLYNGWDIANNKGKIIAAQKVERPYRIIFIDGAVRNGNNKQNKEL